MLMLDTADLQAAEAWDQFYAAAVAGTGICGMTHDPGLEGVARWRIEQWQFGPVSIITTSGPGTRYWQTTRHLRMDSWNTIAGMTQISGRSGFIWNDFQRVVDVGDLALTNKSAGFWEYNRTGINESLSFLIEFDQIGLPESMVHAAVPQVQHSAITPLLLNQVRAVHQNADRLAAGPVAEAVGKSTVALVRALVASVGAGARTRREIAEETLLVRVLAYVRAHLTDPDLTAARIAHVHNISIRSLYRLCEAGDVRLEPWIIQQRLVGARKDLAAPQFAYRTIEGIARSWGFTNASHFTRRFRRAYGMTPRAWREVSRLGRPAGSARPDGGVGTAQAQER